MFIASALFFLRDKLYVYGICIILKKEKLYAALFFIEGESYTARSTTVNWYLHFAFRGINCMFIVSALWFPREKRYVYSICIMLKKDKLYVYSICIMFMLSEGETVCL